MAEKIGTVSVHLTTSGTFTVSLPKGYARDIGIAKKDEMDVLREGDTIIYRPKKEAQAK